MIIYMIDIYLFLEKYRLQQLSSISNFRNILSFKLVFAKKNPQNFISGFNSNSTKVLLTTIRPWIESCFEKCSTTVEHSQCVATKIEFGQSVIRPYPSNESEESFHSRWMYIHLEGRTENGMKAGASNPTGWKMKRKK